MFSMQKHSTEHWSVIYYDVALPQLQVLSKEGDLNDAQMVQQTQSDYRDKQSVNN